MFTLVLISLGNFLFPLPVKLDTYFGQPLTMQENETSEEFGKRVAKQTQLLIDEVNNLYYNERDTVNSYSNSSGSNQNLYNTNITRPWNKIFYNTNNNFVIWKCLINFYYSIGYTIYVIDYGIFTFIQNILITIVLLLSIWMSSPVLIIYQIYEHLKSFRQHNKHKKNM